MGTLLKLFAEALWPARSNASGAPRDVYLRLLVIVMIGIVAGPDFFAVVELTTLLEILGAALFLLTVVVGLRALGVSALLTLRNFLLPAEYAALVRMRERPSAVLHGASLVCRNGVFLCAMGLLAYVWLRDLVRLVS